MRRGRADSIKWLKFALICATMLCVACRTNAGLLLGDTFDYPDGSLVSVSSGQWTTHSGATGELSVVSGRIEINGGKTEDVNALLAGGPYDSTGATNRFYASFVARWTSLPGAGGTYFAHFKGNSSTAFAGRIWAFTAGAASGKFRLGISSGSTLGAVNTNDLSLNTDYLVVARLVNSNSTAKLWINPAAESDASITTQETPDAFTIAAYAFREASGEGIISINNLRVGTSFQDVVTNAIPEQSPAILSPPRNQSCVEGATATFSVAAEAVPQPTFQWRFNGANIPGAASSNLTIANVTFAKSGFYTVAISNALDAVVSEPAALNVFSTSSPAFSLMTYNLHGNGVLNWTTNTSHVRAIGRQVQFLDPDIMTFQEIPVTNNGTAQMENFVAAFRPGFYLATNSSDDLYIRSVIISRYPIVASRSWLHASDLTPYGYSGSGFARDLFEAEIAMPGFPQPLHVFTLHLKSAQDTDSVAKRFAEAGAVSNFFANGFLTTNQLRPCIVTGDMNEDVIRAPTGDPHALTALVSQPTGLRLTTPFNPISGSDMTHSIQSAGGLSRRYDYILPCGLLFSNVTRSEVFRTDLPDPVPSDLSSNDSKTASDHLPVLMVFGNPYAKPFPVSISTSNGNVWLTWPSVPGQQYRIESSSNLNNWATVWDSPPATNEACATSIGSAVDRAQFYRVRRWP